MRTNELSDFARSSVQSVSAVGANSLPLAFQTAPIFAASLLLLKPDALPVAVLLRPAFPIQPIHSPIYRTENHGLWWRAGHDDSSGKRPKTHCCPSIGKSQSAGILATNRTQTHAAGYSGCKRIRRITLIPAHWHECYCSGILKQDTA